VRVAVRRPNEALFDGVPMAPLGAGRIRSFANIRDDACCCAMCCGALMPVVNFALGSCRGWQELPLDAIQADVPERNCALPADRRGVQRLVSDLLPSVRNAEARSDYAQTKAMGRAPAC